MTFFPVDCYKPLSEIYSTKILVFPLMIAIRFVIYIILHKMSDLSDLFLKVYMSSLQLFISVMSGCIWSSSAAVLAASSDRVRPYGSVQVSTLIQSPSDEAASTAADDDQTRVKTCTDPCGLNRSDEAASTAADDDQIWVYLIPIKLSRDIEENPGPRSKPCGSLSIYHWNLNIIPAHNFIKLSLLRA